MRQKQKQIGNNSWIFLLIIGIIGLAVYLKYKPKALPEYNNAEVWSIEWSPDGLPTKVEVKRHAVAGATATSPKQLNSGS